MRRLERAFFARDAPLVAPLMLNKLLVAGVGDERTVGRIVEVEAYTRDDPASHSFRGATNRNAVMFGAAGHLYVYFTYGMHHCANVVTGEDGDGQAVLLRAVQPLANAEAMIRRRGRPRNLSDGPGKLCQAFAIDLLTNGVDLCRDDAEFGLFDDGVDPPEGPPATPRIGIRVGTDRLWRWTM